MQFGILGRLDVTIDGRSIDIRGAKQRALLTLLLLRPNQATSKDAIIDALWGENLNGREEATLRVHIAHLRRALNPASARLGEIILTQAPGYLLRVDPETIDARRFERLATEGRRLLLDDPAGAEKRLIEALSLWRGPALEEVAFEAFAEGEVRRLEELRLAVSEDLFDAQLALGSHQDLVGELETLVAAHPLRERLWGQLMVALYRSGRPADALAAYRRLAHHLGEQLGLDPSPPLQQLEERVLLNDPTLLKPALRIGPHRRPPVERTQLIGRSKQVAELQAKLKAGQLLTLTGTGGVGKTRLAQHLAWCQIDAGTEVWWVELGGLADPELIPAQIAAAGGIAQGPDISTVELLGRLLSEERMTIVLDNCEHLVEACAQIVDELLTQAPELKFIITSREPLQVPGELVWRVPSLPVPRIHGEGPATTFASVELFLERARARGIEIHPSSLEAVATVCRRLDGIPLAIELAAACTTTLSPEDLTTRLNDRFALLERGGRTALARHRTLEAAIDWSFRLLTAADQLLLSRLSVFVIGFDIEAAKAVCGFDPLSPSEIERGIERLVDKSMIEPQEDFLLLRFRCTESIKAFAWDRLPDHPDVILERHRDWALQLAKDGSQGILADEGYWFPRLEAAYGEFRAAFNESLRRGEVAMALRLIGRLGGFLRWRHTNEALEWLERAVDEGRRQGSNIEPATMAGGLLGLGPYLCYHNRLEEGCEVLAEAARLYTELNSPVGLLWTRYQQSFFPASGDPQESLEFAESAVSLARQAGSSLGLAYALSRLAETTMLVSTVRDIPSPEVLDKVLAICEEASIHCQELPQSYASGVTKVVAGTALALQGEEARGFALIDEGIAERGRFHVSVPCAGALISAGELAFRLGYEDRATALFSRGLKALKDEGLPFSGRSGLVGVAALVRKANPTIAARLLGAASALRPSFVYGHCMMGDEDRLFEEVRTELGDDSYLSELGQGQRLSPRNAIDLALSQIGAP